jgi:hypothetical protein
MFYEEATRLWKEGIASAKAFEGSIVRHFTRPSVQDGKDGCRQLLCAEAPGMLSLSPSIPVIGSQKKMIATMRMKVSERNLHATRLLPVSAKRRATRKIEVGVPLAKKWLCPRAHHGHSPRCRFQCQRKRRRIFAHRPDRGRKKVPRKEVRGRTLLAWIRLPKTALD